MHLIAFCNWIREQHTILGFSNVLSANLTAAQRDATLMKIATGKRSSDGLKPSSKEIKEPDPWLGKMNDWCNKKREFLAFLSKKRGVNRVPLVYVIWGASPLDKGADIYIKTRF